MRVGGRLCIGAATVTLPDDRQEVSDLTDDRGAMPWWARSSSVRTLPVAAAGQTAESLAVSAGAEALANAGVPALDLGLLTHSWIVDVRPGPHDCTIAPRLARLLGAQHAVALSMRQMSNGGAISIQIAVAQMLAEPRINHSLVLTADAFGPDASWRWNPEAGTALGDGATAVLLSRGGGSLSIHAIASSSVTEGERWWAEGDQEAPFTANTNVFRVRKCVRTAVGAVFADAGLSPDDPSLAMIVLPRVQPATIEAMFRGLLPTAELVNLSGETGHLFTGDLAANLEYLRTERLPAPGKYALLISFGVGYTVTMLLVRGERED